MLKRVELALALSIVAAPTVAQQRSSDYSPDARQVGKAIVAAFVETYGLADDPLWTRQVDTVLTVLSAAAGYPDPLQFVIVDDSSMNAYATPGGYIIVNAGLLRTLDSAASQHAEPARRFLSYLAAVLGHELAHMTLGHTDSLLGTALRMASDGERDLTLALRSELATLEELGHSREQEAAADKIGALYLLWSGWAIQDAMDLYRLLDDVARTDASFYSLGSVTYLSSHPRAVEREADLEIFRAELKKLQVNYDDAVSLIRNGVGLETAIALLDEVLGYFPQWITVQHARATAYHRIWLNSVSTGVLRVRSSLPTYSTRFVHLIRGIQGDLVAYREAKRGYEAVLAIEPLRATLSNLALLEAYAGDIDRADALARRALDLGGAEAQLINNLGVVLYLADRQSEAYELFRQAYQAAPSAGIMFNVGRTALELGYGPEVLQQYCALDEISPWRDEALRLLGSSTAVDSATPQPLPSLGGVALRSNAEVVKRLLGTPASVEAEDEHAVWWYTDRGITVIVDAENRVIALIALSAAAGELDGVRVGQLESSLKTVLGIPHECCDDQLIYLRADWYLVVQLEQGSVVSVAAVVKDF